MRREKYTPMPVVIKKGEPFHGPDEAWFWTVTCEKNALMGAKISANKALISRPCDPRDIMVHISKLIKSGLLKKPHLMVMKEFGDYQMPPDDRILEQRSKATLWQEAMQHLGKSLYGRGLVHSPDPIYN